MEWLNPALLLAAEIFKLINNERSTKYLNQAVELQLELQAEEAKPTDQQDDAVIVELKKRARVIIAAAKTESEMHRKAA